MKTNFYIIIGQQLCNGEFQYWNDTQNNWIENFTKATVYHQDILSSSLPYGTSGVMMFSKDLEPIEFYEYYSPIGGIRILKKTFDNSPKLNIITL